MAKAKKSEVSVSSLLRSVSVASDKKSEVPMVAGHEAEADAAHKAYVASKLAESEFRSAESEVIGAASSILEHRAQSGNFTNSIYLVGKSTPGVLVKSPGKFCDIPVDQEPALRQVLGSKYEQHFEEKREIKMADTSDATISKLLKALGKDEFEKIFKIKVTIAAKGDMTKDQYDMPAEVRAIIKPYKLSVTAREE